MVLLICAACGNTSATADGGADGSAVDSSADGGAACTLTGTWTCVGKESLPPVSAATIDQPLLLLAQAGGAPVANALVKACAMTDSQCASPVIPATTTDSTGTATFTGLPTGTRGWDGYFEVDYPNDIPNLNFVNPPIFTTFPTYNRAYWSSGALNGIAGLAGVKIDYSSHGVLGIEVHDCSEYPNDVHCVEDGGCAIGKPGGVTVSIDASAMDSTTVELYLTNDNGTIGVSRTATCTSSGGGVSGKVGFVNVLPGQVMITATLPDGTPAAKYTVFVRAGAVSLVELPPTM